MNPYRKLSQMFLPPSECKLTLAVMTLALLLGPSALYAQATADSQLDTGQQSESVVKADTMINVSAASYQSGGELAVDSIVAGFGSDLAAGVAVAASLPLPTELANVKIQVKDSEGVTRLAPLFFVSPAQINYQIPPGTAEGAVSMTVLRNNNMVALGSAKIIRILPGLFSANANGQGVPTALALRVRADNSLNYEPVAQYDGGQGRFIHVPIDLGAESDQVFLVLYGTGFRFNSGTATVLVTAGGLRCEVLYAGPAPGFAGVDQMNVRLPRQLAGRGELTLSVTAGARTSNTVSVVVR